MQVNILDAKNRLSQLVRSAEAGEEVILARRGKAVVRLVVLEAEPTGDPNRGEAGALIDWLESRPVQTPMRNASEIETYIQEMRDAWE